MSHVRTDIQGLRAFAVLFVIIFHAVPEALPGGFLGVDIFFVLSGYLITKTILRDYEKGNFSIAEFYRRRARRLLPALSLVLIISLVAGYYFLSPSQYYNLGMSILSTIGFYSNIYFWMTTGYFDGPAEAAPLLHTWSLSVEEQFYIFYPVLLYWLLKKNKNIAFLATLILGFVGLLVSEATVHIRPNWAYFLTHARAFELLIGCALGLAPDISWLNRTKANYLAAIGILGILFSLLFINSSTPFPGMNAAIPCLGTAMVIAAGKYNPENFIANTLSIRPLTVVGDASYSLYLWHWPLLAFPRAVYGLELDMLSIFYSVSATFFLSILSYKYIEKPFIRANSPQLPYLKLAAILIAFFGVIGTIVAFTGGMPSRFSRDAIVAFSGERDFSPRRAECHSGTVPRPYHENCVLGKGAPSVAVWGDSHGVELAHALSENMLPLGRSVLQITASGCPPALGWKSHNRPHCPKHNLDTLQSLVLDTGIRDVILAGFFQNERYGDTGALLDGLELSVRSLVESGKRVIIVRPIPTYDFDVPQRVGIAIDADKNPNIFGMTRSDFSKQIELVDARLNKISAYSSVKIFDPSKILCDERLCKIYLPDVGSLYFNMNHLSSTGARQLSDAIIEIMSDSVAQTEPSQPGR